ncbi:MAG: sigma 54-interacting transcriptional regulator [Firmicutes bacterium]|nr:sigma 54-interacting transcriptional regulator [Bacillota bacterium]
MKLKNEYGGINFLTFDFVDSFNQPIVICDGRGSILLENKAFQACDKARYDLVKEIFEAYDELVSGLEFNAPIEINMLFKNKEFKFILSSFLFEGKKNYSIIFATKKSQEAFAPGKNTLENFEYVAKDALTLDLLNLINKVAVVDSSVLITGETGVGKEVIANLIYKLSSRKTGRFIKINCTTLPEHLLESELFGYEKGAFTGASRDGKQGLIEAANNGTLLLDEIADMPLSIQVKLLRFLQEHEIYKLGGTKPISLDVRILAATNKDLLEMVKLGKFREDLYYRLNVVPISVPPLRDRPLDIAPLIDYFLAKCNGKYRLNKMISSSARRLLLSYQWPGNVRELQNLIERLVVITDGDLIDVVNLPDNYLIQVNGTPSLDLEITKLSDARNSFEKKYILQVLNKYKSIRKTAKVLGVDHTTILRKLKYQ